jgi:hypothetical protein
MLVDKLRSDLFPPEGDFVGIPDVDERLIEFHLKIGLLWHFAGGGRMSDLDGETS